MAWGDKAYSAEEDSAILAARDNDRLKWKSIAVLIGRESASGCRARYLVLKDREAGTELPVPKLATGRRRPCLSCTEPFDSEGNHNRICPGCTRRIGRWSPLATADDCGAGLEKHPLVASAAEAADGMTRRAMLAHGNIPAAPFA